MSQEPEDLFFSEETIDSIVPDTTPIDKIHYVATTIRVRNIREQKEMRRIV